MDKPTKRITQKQSNALRRGNDIRLIRMVLSHARYMRSRYNDPLIDVVCSNLLELHNKLFGLAKCKKCGALKLDPLRYCECEEV